MDDEPLARRGVRQLLAAHHDVVVVGECRDGREALRALATLSPDLVFLDVQMPGLDGLEVIRLHGAERMPAVVFVTAYDEFAVRAFEAQALDYLVKPLAERRFHAAMDRVRERLRTSQAAALAERLSALLSASRRRSARVESPGGAPRAGPHSRRLAVPSDGGRLLLDPDEIAWIAAADYHADVHAGGRRYRVRESLTSLERRLDPAQFVRVHRSAIVRLDQVRELRRNAAGREAEVVLRDGTRLPVGRRRVARVASLLGSGGRRA